MMKLKRIQASARELARSGKYHGWRPIVFELGFEDGFAEARGWLYSQTTRDELDRICREARASGHVAFHGDADMKEPALGEGGLFRQQVKVFRKK